MQMHDVSQALKKRTDVVELTKCHNPKSAFTRPLLAPSSNLRWPAFLAGLLSNLHSPFACSFLHLLPFLRHALRKDPYP